MLAAVSDPSLDREDRPMVPRISLALFTALAVASSGAGAQDFRPLLDDVRRTLLHEALSGESAKDHVIAISRFHRIQGSRGYRAAAEYVRDQLLGGGYSGDAAFVEAFPSDGRIHYQTWQSPSGWDIERAELRLVEPFDERIVGYPEVAMSLITYSNPGNATAELVWVGQGTSDRDYEGRDVRGKFVLATGYGGEVHRQAVLRHGALGVVCYLDDDRAMEHPDMLQYTGMWPLPDELDRVTFGFNLSKRQGERLRALLAGGRRVVVRGTVTGVGLEPFFMDVPVAVIPGAERPDEELVFAAHLDHPKESANDNASGSAALLDIALTLRLLIDEGRLPQPKRTLRFLWVPEWHGTMAYIDAHPELTGPALGGRVLASINMDMVGENLELIHSAMTTTRTPASIPSALNDVVENMAQMVDRMDVRTARGSLSRFNHRMTPYSGGSDHMMFIDRKIPGVMLGHGPDYTHHTSDDTPDRVDPVELERSELVAAATMLYLADLTEAEATDLVWLTAANAAARLGGVGRRARTMLASAGWPEALSTLRHGVLWEGEAIASVLTFNSGPAVQRAAEELTGQLVRQGESLESLLRDAASRADVSTAGTLPSDDRVPVRTTRGPLDFGLPESALASEDAARLAPDGFPLDGDQRFELVNFIDGVRTVSGIRDALSAEYGPVALDVVGRSVDALVRVGVMEWR
jgi:aminopeptidase YwaD